MAISNSTESKFHQYTSGSLNDGEAEVILKVKEYIQPFERLLAWTELEGIVGSDSLTNVRFEETETFVRITTNVSVEFLTKRLAYWEMVGITNNLIPTQQVVLESSQDSDVGIEYDLLNEPIVKLPNNRKLRYGPHNVHEYRGKFFPQLVKALINKAGALEGSTVFDPFSGSGTTPCEARSMGMKSFSLDLNPLSVKISKVKTGLIDIDPEMLLCAFEELKERLQADQKINPEEIWNKEDLKYLNNWFDPNALFELAFILHAIRRSDDDKTKGFFELCLSNIVRTVSWQKDIDLRVRKEIYDYVPGTTLELFVSNTTNQLKRLIPYLTLLQRDNDKEFLSYEVKEGDSRLVDISFPELIGSCDVLITSPPYATALPYIDTDRLSLVVLGLLNRKSHRHREMLMIGNREISEGQRIKLWEDYVNRKHELPVSVVELIDKIAETNHQDSVGFRRKNLPALLAKYFLDMLDSMRSAIKMMKPNCFAFYVVGNNSTEVDGEKIEIPTDKFLWEIGLAAGWSQEQFIDMDLLPSRDIFKNNRGTSESILVFKSPEGSGDNQDSRNAIYTDQDEDIIKNGEWDFHDEDTQEHLHSLHPYPARFIPQIPRKAIMKWSMPGDTVLDPFSGGGTTLLESILAGRNAIGVDNNAVACLISKAKTAHFSESDLHTLISFANSLNMLLDPSNESGIIIPEYKNIEYWFAPEAIHDLGKIKWLISQLDDGNAKVFALALLSAIIVSVSYQDSDTRYSRKPQDYKKGSAITKYQTKVRSMIQKVKEIIDLPKAESKVFQDDCRKLDFIDSKTVGLIVTSPPYLNAYDYHKYHRHRLHWINGDVSFARDKEIGKHDVFTRKGATPDQYFEDMAQCFSEWYRVLRNGGRALVVVGDAIVSGSPVAVADKFVKDCEGVGFILENRWIRELQVSKKSFNQGARMNKEHVLLFVKQ